MSEKKHTIIVICCCIIVSACLGFTISECRVKRAADRASSAINSGLESGIGHIESATDAAINIDRRTDQAIELNTESGKQLNDVRRDTEEMLGTITEAERNTETSQGAASSLEQLFGELDAEQSELEELLKRATF